MRRIGFPPFLLGITAVLAMLMSVSSVVHAYGDEPSTSTIRIRLKGPTLRVRCRGGDCVVVITGVGTSVTVSITRTRNGVPFTFVRTVENPTNLAIETGLGTDSISITNVAVPGFFRVATRDSDDVLDVHGLSAGRKAGVDMGPGDDVVNLESVTFGGKFRLATRSGDDVITITGGHFAAKAAVDGGSGTDSLSLTPQSFAQPPVVVGFEP
jgi:hypothetical protein